MTSYHATDKLRQIVANELSALIGPKAGLNSQDFYSMLERPKNEDHGDYALPCFRFAKAMKLAPVAVASDFQSTISAKTNQVIANVQAVAGFLNLSIHPGVYTEQLLLPLSDGSYFDRLRTQNAERVMIEYSQPNTHKSFHVGHIRNVALGDALGRLYRFGGYQVTMANYLGDEGAHIAKCLWHIKDAKLSLPSDNRAAWLDEQYRQGTKALDDAKNDPERKKTIEAAISLILRRIEQKSGEDYELWLKTRAWSIEDFEAIYSWFGAHFDHWFYESEVSDESQSIVDEYLAKGIFVEDDGAIGLDLKEDKLGFALLRKRDGNTLYLTKDLALARRKFNEFKIDRSIYVVASEQNLHFKQVFKTLEKMGFPQAKRCFHLSYGMVTLPEGKMSTRTGNTVSFAQLKREILAELDTIMAKYRGQWSDDEIESVKHNLAVGAIRFGMISSDPAKDIVFNLSDWLSFEGFSGPYLMYAFARTRSILAKAEAMNLKPELKASDVFGSVEEIALLRLINDFNNTIEQSIQTAKPSVLAHHLYSLCKAYNRFLAQHSVLHAEDQAERSSRLALVEIVSKVIWQGLALLGITPPDRM